MLCFFRLFGMPRKYDRNNDEDVRTQVFHPESESENVDSIPLREVAVMNKSIRFSDIERCSSIIQSDTYSEHHHSECNFDRNKSYSVTNDESFQSSRLQSNDSIFITNVLRQQHHNSLV